MLDNDIPYPILNHFLTYFAITTINLPFKRANLRENGNNNIVYFYLLTYNAHKSK